MPEDYVPIQTPLEPMRRPLLGIVFCYLAGTVAGVWLTGLDFSAGFILAVLALMLAFVLHVFGRHFRIFALMVNELLAKLHLRTHPPLRVPLLGGDHKFLSFNFFSPRRICLWHERSPPSEGWPTCPQCYAQRCRREAGVGSGLIFATGSNIFVFLAVFLTGWLAVDLRIHSPSARDLSALMDKPREGIELIGIVADDPALRKNRRDDKKYWSFGLRVEAVSRVGLFQKARGEVQVSLPQNETRTRYGEPCSKAPRILQGERWHLRGVLIDNYRLSDLSRTGADKQFIPQRFSFYVDSYSVPDLLTGASRWSFLHWCFFIREKCSVILARGIEHRPDVIAILQALVLGRQHELPLAMREAFVATGTYHIFAISGQHVAIIALFIVFVLQIYGVGRLKWFYYLAPVLIVFTVMTGMSASAVRGGIMALMCFLGPLFKRKPDISSAMALAALLIVGADPLQLFQAGFLLSFGIVAGLIVLCPPLIEMSERSLAPDPWRIEPENWPARSARKIIQWAPFMIIASFAACLVSTPLIARWFNLVSPVALLANLLVIPLATLVLLAGCLSIVFGWCCPFAAEAFNFTNVFFVSLMAGLTKLMAQIPFGHIFVRSPPLWFVYLWFFTLLVWRIYYQKAKIWLSAVLILILAGALAWQLNRNEWEIHVLNIDQCAVCLVNTKENGHLLLNTGPKYQARNVLGYLRKMGVNRLQVLACPISDAKHAGAAGDIINSLPIGEIYLGENKSKTIGKFVRETGGKNIAINEMKTAENCLLPLYSGKYFTLLAGANAATQTLIKAAFKPGQTPSAILIEERPDSFRRQSACSAVTQALCRIILSPTAEEKQWPPSDWSEDALINRDVFLGPGQGVVLLPAANGIEIKSISLGR